jgi:ribosomal 50S subunit-recycling heat shock protein
MRLDQFLKLSRLIKQRSVAKWACDAGRVSMLGRKAKAGTVIKVGDAPQGQCEQGEGAHPLRGH